MKQILQRLAFFSFLGCITLIGIASHSHNPQMKCEQEWKHGFVKNTEIKESLVEAHTRNNGYELSVPIKLFKYFID